MKMLHQKKKLKSWKDYWGDFMKLNITDNDNFVKTDLLDDYNVALKDKDFKFIVDKLNMPASELKNYTSIIESCSCELKNCKNCKGLLECKNRLTGHTYLPTIKNNKLLFHYKPCKYMQEDQKKHQFLNNITYFSCPDYIKDNFTSDIYKTDKNRFEAIKWLNSFKKDYLNHNTTKGLYLHGNFGCGKTFLVSATLNDLASEGIKSAIVFWPDFVRQAFYEDFKYNFDKLMKTPVILIDDIGAENLTAWNRDEILCPLLQYRMDNHLATFFTSNLSLEELEQHLSVTKQNVDIVKAKRIISRIEQLTDNIEMLSKNLRK